MPTMILNPGNVVNVTTPIVNSSINNTIVDVTQVAQTTQTTVLHDIMVTYWPVFVIAGGCILIAAIYLHSGKKKTDPMMGIYAGRDLIVNATKKDIKDKIKTIGKQHVSKLNVLLVNCKGLYHAHTRIGSVIMEYNQEKLAAKDKDSKPENVTYLLVMKRGFINHLKGIIGRFDVVIIPTNLISHSDFVVQPIVDLENHDGVYVYTESKSPSARGLVEDVAFKISQQEALGRYTDFLRQMTYFHPGQSGDIEHLTKEKQLEEEKEKRKIRGMTL